MSQLNTPEKFTLVVEALKAGVVYDQLLSHFERKFIGETADAYAKFGHKMFITGKQWRLFWNIAVKLNLMVVFEYGITEEHVNQWIKDSPPKEKPEEHTRETSHDPEHLET